MSNRHHYLSWRLFMLAIVALIAMGGLISTPAQPLPGGNGISRTTRASDPKVNDKYLARAGNRSAKLSAAEEKHQEIEQAIKDGNEARQVFGYEKALTSYRRAEELDPNDARAYYGLGNVYYAVYCYNSAIDFYSQAVKRKPDYLDALVQLGYAYAKQENYDEAGTQFAAALSLSPKNLDAKLGSFYVLAKRGKQQEAVEGINQIIIDKSIGDKDRGSAYMALGKVYVAQNKWQESIGPFEKATHLNSDSADAFLELGMSQVTAALTPYGQQDTTTQDKEKLSASARLAVENIRTAIDVKHYDHPNGYLILGMALMYESNYKDALKKINDYLVKVKELETKLSGLDSRLGQRCDYAFNRAYADGYWYLGFVYVRLAAETGANKDDLLNKAIEQLKNAIEAKQDYANAYDELGLIYISQQKYGEAIDQLKKALVYETSTSSKGSTYGVVGAAYSQIGPDNEAIYYLNKAIEANPNDSSNYSTLALVFERQGDLDQAIHLLEKAKELAREPRASPYYGLATAYFLRARKDGNNADYEQAIKLLNEAIKINPSFAPAYLALANIYKFYKDAINTDATLANYELAKQYDPQNPLVYFSLGDFFIGKNNTDAAIANLRQAIKLKEDYAQAYWALGIVYEMRHDDAEAVNQLLKAIKYDDKYLDAYLALTNIYLNQKNYPELIKYLNKATELAPTNPKIAQYYLMLGTLYRTQQNFSEAVNYLNKSIEIAPTDFHPYKELAKVFEAQGLSKDAIHDYEEAIKYYGNAADSFPRDIYSCRIERLQGRFEEAIRCFQKIKVPASEDPGTVLYDIGATYVASKNKKAALAQYEQLKTLKSTLADDLLRQIHEMW